LVSLAVRLVGHLFSQSVDKIKSTVNQVFSPAMSLTVTSITEDPIK
jgi:hypothetical protein